MRAFLPLLALPLLAACTGSSVHLGFTVYPDKSGEYEQMSVVLEDTPVQEEGEWLQGMEVRSAQRLKVQQATAAFLAINDVDAGGIRFKFDESKSGFVLEATIRTTAQAEWVRRLAPTPEQVDRIAGAMEKGFEGSGRQVVLMNHAQGMSFAVVSVQMPGNVTDATLTGASWKVEVGREEKLMMGGRNRVETDTAYLWIPIKDVHANATEAVTLRISCGELTEERAFAWEQVKHKRAATEAERARAEAMKKIADLLGARMQEMDLPEGKTGVKFVEALGVQKVEIGLRGPKAPVQVFGEMEDILICEEPAEEATGIYGVTRAGVVIWLRKGTKLFEKALKNTDK